MRTKTLLLTAALCAAGVATSMAAAVYSVNAVGYVNTTLKPGFNLVSNPLTGANNAISSLFAGLPPNTTVYKYVPGTGYKVTSFDPDDLVYEPTDVAALTVVPGEGVFVFNPGSTDLTVTFVGEVSQSVNNAPLVTTLAKGFSIVSSQVPQAGTASDLGLVGEPNDTVYQYVPGSGYAVSSFDPDDLKWEPDLGQLKVGEAFFLNKVNAGTWSRTFTVNAQ